MENKKKNTKIIVLLISIIAIIASIGLFAYFTDVGSVRNKIKIGIVSIKLDEYTIDSNGNKIKISDGKMITPGEVVSRIPEISCTPGSEDCYIRARVDFITQKDQRIIDNTLTSNILNIDTNKWYYCKEDGYYYYKTVLTDKSESAVFFTQISFPKEINNNWSLADIRLEINAEAIQARNFTPDFSNGSKEPWPGIKASNIKTSK